MGGFSYKGDKEIEEITKTLKQLKKGINDTFKEAKENDMRHA